LFGEGWHWNQRMAELGNAQSFAGNADLNVRCWDSSMLFTKLRMINPLTNSPQITASDSFLLGNTGRCSGSNLIEQGCQRQVAGQGDYCEGIANGQKNTQPTRITGGLGEQTKRDYCLTASSEMVMVTSSPT
jgi:hypothetical protein